MIQTDFAPNHPIRPYDVSYGEILAMEPSGVKRRGNNCIIQFKSMGFPDLSALLPTCFRENKGMEIRVEEGVQNYLRASPQDLTEVLKACTLIVTKGQRVHVVVQNMKVFEKQMEQVAAGLGKVLGKPAIQNMILMKLVKEYMPFLCCDQEFDQLEAIANLLKKDVERLDKSKEHKELNDQMKMALVATDIFIRKFQADQISKPLFEEGVHLASLLLREGRFLHKRLGELERPSSRKAVNETYLAILQDFSQLKAVTMPWQGTLAGWVGKLAKRQKKELPPIDLAAVERQIKAVKILQQRVQWLIADLKRLPAAEAEGSLTKEILAIEDLKQALQKHYTENLILASIAKYTEVLNEKMKGLETQRVSLENGKPDFSPALLIDFLKPLEGFASISKNPRIAALSTFVQEQVRERTADQIARGEEFLDEFFLRLVEGMQNECDKVIESVEKNPEAKETKIALLAFYLELQRFLQGFGNAWKQVKLPTALDDFIKEEIYEIIALKKAVEEKMDKIIPRDAKQQQELLLAAQNRFK